MGSSKHRKKAAAAARASALSSQDNVFQRQTSQSSLTPPSASASASSASLWQSSTSALPSFTALPFRQNAPGFAIWGHVEPFLHGLLTPLQYTVSTLRPYLVWVIGFLLGWLLLYSLWQWLVAPILWTLFAPWTALTHLASLWSHAASSSAAAAGHHAAAAFGAAAPSDGWFTVCAPSHPLHRLFPRFVCHSRLFGQPGGAFSEAERAEIAKRYGIALSTEDGLKNMTNMVHWVTHTPAAARILQITRSASSMSAAFRHKTDLVSKEAICRDLDGIADKADLLIDAAIDVETSGRTIAKEMIAGYEEILHMLEQRETYAAAQIELKLNKHLRIMEDDMDRLQEMLVRAQTLAGETLATQRSLMGKLYSEQTDLEDQQVRFLDANSIMNKIWGTKPEISEVQYHKLKRNLELCTFVVQEMQDWNRHFSNYLLYLRTYRAHVRAGRKQYDEHLWTTGDLTLEDRIRSMGRLMEPAKARLMQYEENQRMHRPAAAAGAASAAGAIEDGHQPVNRPGIGASSS